MKYAYLALPFVVFALMLMLALQGCKPELVGCGVITEVTCFPTHNLYPICRVVLHDERRVTIPNGALVGDHLCLYDDGAGGKFWRVE